MYVKDYKDLNDIETQLDKYVWLLQHIQLQLNSVNNIYRKTSF